MRTFEIVIVGAGQAGAQTAISLRQGGFQGSIAIVGEQPDLPYELPPLSKDYLAGEKSAEQLLLRPATFWSDRHVEMIVNTRIDAVSPADHHVAAEGGDLIGYGKLIWAAGGAPRRLPMVETPLANIHGIRTRADVDRLRADIEGAADVVVVGGGYIGLEAAAVMTKAGNRVVVLEALDRVLARVTSETISRFYEAEHRAAGVDVRTNCAIVEVIEKNGRALAVRTAEGEIPCDAIVVGIGILPNVAPLAAAGCEVGNGAYVDEYCRTSLEDVFAIGDCAFHHNEFAAGERVRIESVQNAVDQAKTVASFILGDPKPYHAIPWFWSNQYDLRLQTQGLNIGYDRTIVRGDPATRSFSVIYFRGREFAAIDCVCATKDFVQGKALVGKRFDDPENLADASVPLKQLAAV